MVDISIWYLFLSVLGGIAVGVVAGLLPGVHVNNTAAILLGLSPLLAAAGLLPLYVAAMIISSTIAQSFLDIVPSIFLGAPDEATVLAVMPGQKMLLEGRGIEAVRVSAMGSALAIPASLLLILPLSIFFRLAYPLMMEYMALILIAIAAFIILTNKADTPFPGMKDRVRKIAWGLAVFIAAGLLGLASFSIEPGLTPIINLAVPTVLLPLLSGLFGAPLLIMSFMATPAIPRQAHNNFTMKRSSIIWASVSGTIAGALVSWFPAVSSGVATSITGVFSRREDDSDRRYLISVAGVNTANAIFSLVALYVIGRPRSGAVAAAQTLLGGAIGLDVFILFLAVICITGVAAYLLTVALGSSAASLFIKIDYRLLNRSVLLFLAVLCLLMTGVSGLAVFMAAAAVGMAAHIVSVRKTCLMGVLLIPCILYFL